MHRLLFDPQQGFRSALLRGWSAVVEANELKAGEPVPGFLRGRSGVHVIKVYALDPGVALDGFEIAFDRAALRHPALGFIAQGLLRGPRSIWPPILTMAIET